MHRVLYFVSSCNCAVEELGYTKIEILRRFSSTDVIFVADGLSFSSTKECIHFIESQKIDLVVFEDEDYERELENLDFKQSPFVIGVKHGTPPRRKYDLVLSHIIGGWSGGGVLYLPFSPGNIFKCLNKEKRDKKIAIFSRLAKFKREQAERLIRYLQVDKIDAYVPREDGPNADIDVLDLVDIKGKVERNEITEIYNEYDYVAIPECECLCLPLREALLCGCVPILSSVRMISKSYNYYTELFKYCHFPECNKSLQEKIKYVRSDITQKEIHDKISFDRMVISLLMYMRSLFTSDVKWYPKKSDDTVVISLRPKHKVYNPDKLNYRIAVNWKEVLKC